MERYLEAYVRWQETFLYIGYSPSKQGGQGETKEIFEENCEKGHDDEDGQ